MFTYLVYKWSVKRAKEIFKRFEYELREMEDTDMLIKETDNKIASFKAKYNEALFNKDKITADVFLKEIKRLEKERRKLFRGIKRKL
jgi:hypothetical protein